MSDGTNSTNDREYPRTREELWERLRALIALVDKGGFERLTDRQVEDLGVLYRAAATHLAYQRVFGASARRKEELNQLVSRAHAIVYGRTPRTKARGSWFLWSFLAFPVTVRNSLRYHALAALLLVLGAVYGYFGAAADPDWTLSFVFPGDDRTPYASRDELLETLRAGRGGEVDSASKTVFAAVLWQHNTKVALFVFFTGFLAAIPTVLLMLQNGIMLGTYTYTFTVHDLGYEWWAWILPHGITELLAIVLLAGGGLWIGHIVIAPGDRGRAARFRGIRGDLVRLVCFAFPMLFLAALIESFVRQSQLGDTGRYVFAAISAIVWGLYLGLVRPPRRLIELQTAPVTVAERAVPLPTAGEILGTLDPHSARESRMST